MCNDYRLEVDAATIAEDFENLKVGIFFSEGVPNIQARSDIKITDTAPIVRTVGGYARGWRSRSEAMELAGTGGGKPVYNFRSEGREFSSGRCLIVADGFYEFTKPDNPRKKLRTSGCSQRTASAADRRP